MNKLKIGILSPEKTISPLQMSLTFVLVINLILSNIIVVKSINLFGAPWLANTCAILTFPVTYILSDLFSEVYGYKWSRKTATWAFAGSFIASALFALTIVIPGNSAWQNQDALVSILGNTPVILIASLAAFWIGDLVNDKIFEAMKRKSKNGKLFPARAILSSLGGKYIDGLVFTFIGLWFLPLETKIIMVLTCPAVQIAIEILLLPVTSALVKKVKAIESFEGKA